MSRELKGWARPRPLRIAFLVEDGAHANLTLDGIFADCYGRWGGRFSIVAPCLNKEITDSYWPWLESYDPDIVYSYVSLSKESVLEIYEKLSPSEYIFHKRYGKPRLDVYGFKPSYDFAPLSSLSTIFRWARHSTSPFEESPTKIIDSWHTEKPSQFLTDNFGTYRQSGGSSIFPSDARAAASLLTVVSPKFQKDRKFAVPLDLDAIPSELEAFSLFSDGQATSLSIASALFAPKLEIHAGRWSDSFNLVIGDTFADRILFWNARLLIPAWLDKNLCCLRISLEQLKEPSFLSALDKLLKYRNYISNGSGGPKQVTVRSVSLSADQLAEAEQQLISTKPWYTLAIELVTGLDNIVPSADALKTAREGNRFSDGIFSRPDWTTFVWTPPSVRAPPTLPDHLSDAPARQIFTQGFWATDFRFEYDGPGGRYSSDNLWMLPNRWRMAGAFKVSSYGENQHTISPKPRRSRGGNLAIFVTEDHPVETIKVPTAYQAIQYAFASDGAWSDPDSEPEVSYPLNKVTWTDPSNEARYLTGVLGMTGGLELASAFLLHPFLRETFAKLGGTPNLPTDQMESTINRLVKKSRQETNFDLSSEKGIKFELLTTKLYAIADAPYLQY